MNFKMYAIKILKFLLVSSVFYYCSFSGSKPDTKGPKWRMMLFETVILRKVELTVVSKYLLRKILKGH